MTLPPFFMKNKAVFVFLPLLFFFSGFSALVYQVAWQRSLFAVLGSDIDSITIIIALFMLGLGIGAIFGGQISNRFPEKDIHTFSLLEILTGLYGFFSLDLIKAVSLLGVSSHLFTSLLAALLLFFPTLFMGATLPVLVNFINKRIANAGHSVATLYFVNTLGAACASIFTVVLIFEFLGLKGSVNLAASLNLSIGAIVWIGYRREQ